MSPSAPPPPLPPPPPPPEQPIAVQRVSPPTVSAVAPAPVSGKVVPQLSQARAEVTSTSAADLLAPAAPSGVQPASVAPSPAPGTAPPRAETSAGDRPAAPVSNAQAAIAGSLTSETSASRVAEPATSSSAAGETHQKPGTEPFSNAQSGSSQSGETQTREVQGRAVSIEDIPAANSPVGNVSDVNIPGGNAQSGSFQARDSQAGNPQSENAQAADFQSGNVPEENAQSGNFPAENAQARDAQSWAAQTRESPFEAPLGNADSTVGDGSTASDAASTRQLAPRPAAAAAVRPEAALGKISFSNTSLTLPRSPRLTPESAPARTAERPAIANPAAAAPSVPAFSPQLTQHRGDPSAAITLDSCAFEDCDASGAPSQHPNAPSVSEITPSDSIPLLETPVDGSGDRTVEVSGPQAEMGLDQTTLSSPAGADLPACNPDRVIVVETIAVSCSTILTEATVAQVLQPFLGRPLSAQDQQEAADALTRYYLEAGYITSRALPQDSPTPTKQLHLRVIEGGIDAIAIDGLDRLHEDYLRSRISLATQPPINTARLEDQLRLLRQSPLLDNIEASLLPGNTPGNSTLRVRVDEANPFTAFVGLDNYSPPVLGTTQGTLALTHQNLTGRGDRLSGSVVRTTTGGRTTATLGYAIPLNPMEGTLQVSASFEDTRIPLAPGLDVSGNSQTYGISFRQPLIRTPREELALSLGFDYQNGQTFIGDQPLSLDPNGISTAVVRFGQDYVSRDRQGAWALRSRFSLGTGLFGATAKQAPLPDGQFFSWLGQAQRVQRLSDDHLLIISADVQLTPDPLLSSEKFVLGGAQTVRGYRQNLVGGDNGFRIAVEDRITLQRDEAGLPTLQLAPFVDLGSVWNVGSSPPPVQGFLMGLGLGLIWEPTPQLNLRVDYGLPLVNSPSRGNSWQEQGIYFQLGYRL